MKFLRNLALVGSLALYGWSGGLQAEDIDIYVDAAVNGGVPNVLFVFDNGANFSSSANNTCTYEGTNGEVPSLGNTAGGIEQCALYNVIYGLKENSVNIGLMMFNGNNMADWTGNNCGSSNGGCLVVPLTAMTPALKTQFLNYIKSWRTSGGAGAGYVKADGDATAASMQESWAYYRGQTGASGRNYAGIRPSEGCQNNYVIYVGNAFTTSGTGGDTGNYNLLTALNNAVPPATADQKSIITVPSGSYGTSSFSCGNYTMSPHNNGSGLWADEWARYMQQTDISSTFEGVQNITTYTIGLLGPSCKPDYPALLTSMADVGGGKYFATTDYTQLKTAIDTILNEVQAVNSVFSAASLPVSVNAQGTYENQIFLGMFRPDASAAPRWVGNLKQFQFILEYLDPTKPDPNTATLRLGDKNGNPAISSAGTGFISPDAVSFWTYKNTAANPDATGGFFINDAKGSGGAFDSADGEYVEKGGAAQIARVRNLSNDYAGNPTGPRKVFTYCPANSSCDPSLAATSNQFATSNAAITDAMLGAVASVGISTIARVGTTATVTTSSAHGLQTGDTVTIAGSPVSEYNGSKNVTLVNATQFSFAVVENPPSPAVGSYTATLAGAGQLVSTLTRSGTVATVTTVGAHLFTAGQQVTITGASPSDYNGLKTILSTPTPQTFTFAVTETPRTPAGSGTATVGANTFTIAAGGVIRSGTTVTISTTANHGFKKNNTVTLDGIVDSNGAEIAAYKGSFKIDSVTNADPKQFTIVLANSAIGPSSPATGTIYANGGVVRTITALTRVGNTATATSVGHGFTAPGPIAIGGSGVANEAPYVGTFNITNVTADTFDYTITTTPATPAAGGTVTKATTTNRESLIRWVRGEDNYGDEGTPGGSYNVRASIHGDVLHSRPVVINYGDERGTVVFYGANDGVYRAVNGNQEANIGAGAGAVQPGGELWSLILPEHFGQLARQRVNFPELRFPSTTLASAKRKDYFVDGPTGIYQKLKEVTDINGKKSFVIDKAYIYLTMRRGGRFMYAMDVSDPTAPTFKWRVSHTDTGFGELGQTWSRPRLTLTNAKTGPGVNDPDVGPVIVFGGGYAGGYDANGNALQEDAEPPTANTMGRAIYVLNAETGERIWSAQQNCGGTPNCVSVPDMLWSIPSDIAFLDRDNNGRIDRMYAPDMGGNLWRVDINSTDVANWSVTKIAALGCDTGTCASGTTPRKFFFPPAVVSVGATGAAGAYDAVMLAAGDREHPLQSSDPNSAHLKRNSFYMIKDTATGMSATAIAAGSPALPITEANLKNATSAAYVKETSDGGFRINFSTGEKAVNAPVTVFGTTYVGTNKPVAPAGNVCTSNLGEARGYAINPFTGAYSSAVYDGGGLPPSPTAGLVSIKVGDKTVTKQFCIGCGGGSPVEGGGTGDNTACNSALENCANPQAVPRNPRRTYWYRN